MDVCRKYLQLGRVRCERYAYDPKGGKTTRSDDETGEEVEITADKPVRNYDTLIMAQNFQDYEDKCWHDEVYRRKWVDFGGKEEDLPAPGFFITVESLFGEGFYDDAEAPTTNSKGKGKKTASTSQANKENQPTASSSRGAKGKRRSDTQAGEAPAKKSKISAGTRSTRSTRAT